MKIENDTNLADLAERLGDCATELEAEVALDILLKCGYRGLDTADVPPDVWDELLEHIG